MNDELTKVRDWAQGQLDAEHVPPWATRRALQVVVLIDEMLASRTRASQRTQNVVHLDFARRCRARRPANFRA